MTGITNLLKKYGIPPRFQVTVHEADGGGYWLESKNLPGLYTQGETLDELFKNLEDAILTYFDVPRKVTKGLPRFLSLQPKMQIDFSRVRSEKLALVK